MMLLYCIKKMMILKKVYENNQAILTVINVWRQCLQVKRIILPILVHRTHDLFKYGKKVSIFQKEVRKICWVSLILSNMFGNCLSKIGCVPVGGMSL